jgi:hypothetical protein
VRKKAGVPVRINFVEKEVSGTSVTVVSGSAISISGSTVSVVSGSAITLTGSALGVDFTSHKIASADDTLEYSDDNAGSWNDCVPASENTVAEGATILVRKKAGIIQSVIFTDNQEVPSSPSVRVDDQNNTILGANSSMEYSIDGGVTWISYDENNPPKFAGRVDVKIRVKAGADHPAGEVTTLHFYSNPTPTPTPKPAEKAENSKSDEKPKRQIEVSLDSVPAVSVDIIRSEENMKIVDSVTIDLKAVEETLKIKKNTTDKIRIYVNDDKEEPADEVHFTIKADALKKISDSGLEVEIKSDDVTITLSTEGLQKLVNQNKELYFHVIPVKDRAEKEAAIQDTLSSELVKEYAKYGIIDVFGTPMTIETNYENQKTDVVFSPKNITLPENSTLKEKVLSNLAVYIIHSDGDKEILPGTMVYQEDGTFAGVKITIDKFSTFNFISKINTAPTLSNLVIKKKDQSGKTLAVTYSYEDADQDKEGKTTYQWYRADNKAGKNKIKIVSANKSSYKITEKDQGKYLICKVIPVAKEGAITGRSYTVAIRVPKQEQVQEPSKKTDKEADKSTVKDTVQKSGATVKLGLIGSKKYAEELGDIFKKKYHATNVKVEQESRYYRVSAEFGTTTEAEKVCKDLKNKNYIINYYITGIAIVK